MRRRGFLARWLVGPPLKGWRAVSVAVAAVVLPTVLRFAVTGSMPGYAFAGYFPFALFAAVLLGPWLAALVAISSIFVANYFFLDPKFSFALHSASLVGAAVLLFCAALTILLVWEVRREFAANKARIGTGEAWKGIVFSSLGGQALASWYDGPSHVRLGPEDEVAQMMEDFLAQVELGKRLNGNGGEEPAAARLRAEADFIRCAEPRA